MSNKSKVRWRTIQTSALIDGVMVYAHANGGIEIDSDDYTDDFNCGQRTLKGTQGHAVKFVKKLLAPPKFNVSETDIENAQYFAVNTENYIKQLIESKAIAHHQKNKLRRIIHEIEKIKDSI